MRAAYPNCVFVRDTAAKLSWWPEADSPLVQCAAPHRIPARKGFAFERRAIPPELTVWNGTHFLSSPPLTVLDQTDTRGGHVIDEALRRGVLGLDDLRSALAMTPARPGNKRRIQLVHESRDEPWSELEREAHVLLRDSQVRGWTANHRVEAEGETYFLDLAVPEHMVAAEIDGWQHHKSHQSFIADRNKWNALTLAGWTLLVFTNASIDSLAEQMRAGLALAKRR